MSTPHRAASSRHALRYASQKLTGYCERALTPSDSSARTSRIGYASGNAKYNSVDAVGTPTPVNASSASIRVASTSEPSARCVARLMSLPELVATRERLRAVFQAHTRTNSSRV